MKNNPITIGITGMSALPENPAPGISVASCLRAAFGKDIRIIGLGYDVFDVGLYIENFCDAAYLLPYPRMGSEALLLRLSEIQNIEHINVLIPCLDSELLGIISISDKLVSLGIKTLIPTKEQLVRCFKDRLAELAIKVNLHYPDSKILYNDQFFNTCQFEGWAYPLVIKGPFYDARKVMNRDEALEAFHAISKDWGFPILVQRYIEGEECNLLAIGDGTGKLIGEVIMKKVVLTSKNKACVGVTIYDENLIHFANGIINELKWKGPFELEVMCDTNHNYHLIEINPRFPAWVSLSEKVGRNLPARIVEILMELPLTPFDPPKVGSYLIRYANEQMVDLQQIEKMTTYGSSVVSTKD